MPATVLLAGMLAIAFALTACSTGGTTVSSAELAKLQLDSDTRQIERIEVVEAFESLVEVVRADVLRESARGKQPQPYCAHQVQKDNPR